MITGLDHIVLACPEIASGSAVYTALLGARPVWQAQNDDGSAVALFRLANTVLELIAPGGPGPVGDRLRTMIADEGPGLKSLAFSCDDIAETHRVLSRRGLSPDAVSEGASTDRTTGAVRSWRRFRLGAEASAGLRLFVINRPGDDPVTAAPAATDPGAMSAIDHVVVATNAPDRAAALCGARLGLRLALDRTAPEWNTRFLFFRTGGVTLEYGQKLDAPASPLPDRLGGACWRTEDVAAAHARLDAAGLALSPLRIGRKPGTRVFTVRDGTLGVPTLVLGPDPDAPRTLPNDAD